VSGKFALIIANTEYIDSGLAQLTAPGKDAEDFAHALRDKGICAFDQVNILLNQLSSTVIEAIDEFFDQKKPDDLLILYFSGHGLRDEFGSLYLAVRNTIRSRLRSTAIRSDYIREAIDQSRSKRQVVILDCCNSGAFPQGTKAEIGGTMGMLSALQGYGRFILTASDATQFAWEGNRVIGETQNSLFTHFLVKGLEGEADSDGDGRITVDELYDYAYEQISRVTPRQTPTKSSSKQEGEIILRDGMRFEDIKLVPLPAALLDSIENPFPDVRLGALQQLIKLLNGKNIGLARSAQNMLEHMAAEDDSYRVRQAAAQTLELRTQEDEGRKTVEQVEIKRKAHEEPGLSKVKEPKKKPIKHDIIPVEQKVAQKPQHLATPKLAMQTISPEILKDEKKAGKANLAKPRRAISQRGVLSLTIAILVISLTSLGGYYLSQNMVAVPTPTQSSTKEPLTATAVRSETPSNTPSPTATLKPEVYLYIAVTRALMYKGPAMEYGLASTNQYPKGEQITVLARNPSGQWLLGRASDGNEGWLYTEWVELSFDPLEIPTASDIPPLPVTPTKKGPGGSNPTATCAVIDPGVCD
jgi:hypothetical protein